MQFQELHGNLLQGVTYGNVELTRIKGLPEGSSVRIQNISVLLASLSFDGIVLKIDNARLFLPNSDNPLVFWFSLNNGELNGNLFAGSISLREILPVFPLKIPDGISGMVTDMDIYFKGPYKEPRISGKFHIEEISRGGFLAVDCPSTVTLALRKSTGVWSPFGEILVKSGTLSGPRTAAVSLNESKILFSGSWDNPSLDLSGRASVEDTKIKISVKGTAKAPQLQLSSQPSKAEEKLLVMLATDRSWKGAENIFGSKQISADLAKDFIDYFAFSGEGNAIAKRFGISNLSIKFDKEAKGFGVTKDVSGRLKASYGIEQTQKTGEPAYTTQKVGGTVKLTDAVSAEATKEVLPKIDAATESTTTLPSQRPRDEILLKYKKNF